MGTPTIVRTTAVVILAAGLGASAVLAEDQIKAGKWEFSALAPGVTRVRSGVQLPPGTQIGPAGMTFSHTECISPDNPLPPMAREPSALTDANHSCKIDKTEVSGGAVSWSMTCTTTQTTIHEEWIVHYHGETLDGEFTVRVTNAGRPPIERSQPLTGRYLGSCDGK